MNTNIMQYLDYTVKILTLLGFSGSIIGILRHRKKIIELQTISKYRRDELEQKVEKLEGKISQHNDKFSELNIWQQKIDCVLSTINAKIIEMSANQGKLYDRIYQLISKGNK